MATVYVLAVQVFVLFLPLTRSKHLLGALETPIREAQLLPRNFNPHPYLSYETGPTSTPLYTVPKVHSTALGNAIFDSDFETQQPIRKPTPTPNGIFSQGPVLFPAQDTNDVGNRRRPPHRYATAKSRTKFPRSKNVATAREYDDESNTMKHYAFSYTVRDSESGDDFSHSQQQKNGAVHGTYKVHLPDGRIQVVKYTADSGGYRADVSYLNGASTDDAPPTPSFIPLHEAHNNHYHTTSINNHVQAANHLSDGPQIPHALNVKYGLLESHPQSNLIHTGSSNTATSSIFVSTSNPTSGISSYEAAHGHHHHLDYALQFNNQYHGNGLLQRAETFSNGGSGLFVDEPHALYYKTHK